MVDQFPEEGNAPMDERLTALERRVAALEALAQVTALETEGCRMQTCGYFLFYLAQGPADLPHEGFHAAELQCEVAQKEYMLHLDRCPKCNGGEISKCGVEKSLRRQAQVWEGRVRA